MAFCYSIGMKIQETSIEKVTADRSAVDIHFIPKGSDSADKPFVLRVIPHSKHILLSLNNAEFLTTNSDPAKIVSGDGCNYKIVLIQKIPRHPKISLILYP